MTERHAIHPPVVSTTPDGGVIITQDEEHTFTASPTCDSDGLLGYTSMRCAYRYLGCQDRACVCRCHDAAQPVTDDEPECGHDRAKADDWECPECGADLVALDDPDDEQEVQR